jgi:cyclase
MTTVLRHGADKVSINSAAIANPDLIDAGARKFGSQCIVLSMDVKEQDGRYYVYQNGGRVNTGIDAIEWAQEGVRRGAGELVINSMNHDGMKQGFDIELLRQITDVVSVPVIASGGAGTIEHFRELALVTDVDGYLAASVFHFGEIAISDLKRDLAEAGIPIRVTR